MSLVELGVPRTSLEANRAADHVLDWIVTRRDPDVVGGRERRHASMEGNALAVASRLGKHRDKRVKQTVEVLLRAQWPDGGWNCDRRPGASHSSFHESLAPIWGLVEYHRETGDQRAWDAAQAAGELLLRHELFKSTRTGAPIDSEWMHIHWPHYWHYDFFHGLRAVAMLGKAKHPRAKAALDHLGELRGKDGTWHASGRRYWTRSTEVVNWGDAHDVITAAAERIVPVSRYVAALGPGKRPAQRG
ncbi:MAG TPA: hypothetical protein VFL29_08570 [Candidatus Dormibacteraeota bacterium]|nr:hypothetical protein [Candidatus Dormibacteraeota bacterium]